MNKEKTIENLLFRKDNVSCKILVFLLKRNKLMNIASISKRINSTDKQTYQNVHRLTKAGFLNLNTRNVSNYKVSLTKHGMELANLLRNLVIILKNNELNKFKESRVFE